MGGGLTWPSSLGFVHIAENQSEVVDGVDRFMISPALTDVFLPWRRDLMIRFIRTVAANQQPIILEADGATLRRTY
jgi:hypothetical protein